MIVLHCITGETNMTMNYTISIRINEKDYETIAAFRQQ